MCYFSHNEFNIILINIDQKQKILNKTKPRFATFKKSIRYLSQSVPIIYENNTFITAILPFKICCVLPVIEYYLCFLFIDFKYILF